VPSRSRRHGKITIITIFALLGLLVMAGFIGNVGHITTNKIATQNAADSIAFSSAQWMARGMNAATATNHMLGEVTGLVVVIEGVAGPETYTSPPMEFYTTQNRTLDQVIRVLKDLAPAGNDTPGIYGEKALGGVEKQVINKLVDQTSPEDDDKAKSKAWATIYDSKIQLKMDLSKWLLAKTIANLGFFVPPPWGYISAAIAYAAHIYSDVQIAEIGKEWFIIEGIEIVVANRLVAQLKDKMETLVIPVLAGHGDFIAGRVGKKDNSKPQAKAGIVNAAVSNAQDTLGKVYDLKAISYPLPNSLLMPIEAEPAPSMKGTPVGKEEKEWGKDEVVTLPDADDTLKKIQDNIDDSKEKIEERMNHLKERIALMNRLEADVDKLSKEKDVQPDEKQAFDDEKKAIAAARTQMQARLKDLEEQMAKLNKKQAQLQQTLAQLKDIGNSSGNLSAKRKHLALENRPNEPQMNQAEERYTQWVRATFPYVDTFRAPSLKKFSDSDFFSMGLTRSGFPKHFEKWTNRYTLTKAWQFRSGARFIKTGDTDAEWQKKKDPLEMYVMKGSYDRKAVTGQRRDLKGFESWTSTTPKAKNEAEEMFTVVSLTHRKIEPLFSPVIYPNGSKNGTSTFAQAVFYNANEQNPGVTRQPVLPTQLKIGWDTLNWDPSGSTPEWGNKLAVANPKWPWDIFTPNDNPQSSAKVRLNWQAKLMPVTKTRLKGFLTTPMSTDMYKNVAGAYGLFDSMVTH
jgi:hypothetical protein